MLDTVDSKTPINRKTETSKLFVSLDQRVHGEERFDWRHEEFLEMIDDRIVESVQREARLVLNPLKVRFRQVVQNVRIELRKLFSQNDQNDAKDLITVHLRVDLVRLQKMSDEQRSHSTGKRAETLKNREDFRPSISL